MRILFLLLCAVLITAELPAATVQSQITNLGGNSYNYSYTLSGFTLQANQAIDIQFDPSLYGALSNQKVSAGFTPVLFQPNNPPGTAGDYIALANMNNPSVTGTFGVNFLFKGAGAPGAQPYFIDQFDANGNFVSVLGSGRTAPVGTSNTPEPGTFWLGGMSLLLVGAAVSIRRRLAVS